MHGAKNMKLGISTYIRRLYVFGQLINRYNHAAISRLPNPRL